MAWTAERVGILKDLWAKGYSASQIAYRLGGCTRNAVIGKVHRLNLPGRLTKSRAPSPKRRAATGSPERPPAKAGRLRAPKMRREFEFAPLDKASALATIHGIHPEDAMINRRPLAELDSDDCRFPIGDPHHMDFGFCGAPALHGRPYCPRHAARAYSAE